MELKQLIKQQKAKGVLVKTLAHPSLVIKIGRAHV